MLPLLLWRETPLQEVSATTALAANRDAGVFSQCPGEIGHAHTTLCLRCSSGKPSRCAFQRGTADRCSPAHQLDRLDHRSDRAPGLDVAIDGPVTRSHTSAPTKAVAAPRNRSSKSP